MYIVVFRRDPKELLRHGESAVQIYRNVKESALNTILSLLSIIFQPDLFCVKDNFK